MAIDDSSALRDFLQKLDNADLEVSDWEAQFIESCLQREHYTPPQRERIMQMMTKYGKRIGYL